MLAAKQAMDESVLTCNATSTLGASRYTYHGRYAPHRVPDTGPRCSKSSRKGLLPNGLFGGCLRIAWVVP